MLSFWWISLWQQQVKALDEKKSEKGTLMSEYALAALMGYAGVTSWRELPGLYPVIKSIKDNTESREVILQGMKMKAWSVKNGIEISEYLYFPEELIKNIRAVKPNPTGMVGVSRVSDTEVTNLACLPLRVSEIKACPAQRRIAQRLRKRSSWRGSREIPWTCTLGLS